MQTPNPKHTPRRIVLTLLCLLMAAAIMLSCTQCKKQEEKTDAASKAETSDTKDGGGTKSDASADALTFMTPEIPDDGPEPVYDENEGVYVYNKMAFELCGASDGAGEDYADAVSEFKKAYPDTTIYNMVIPNHTEFGLPTRLSEGMSSSQSQNIKHIYTSYSQDVKPINCYNALCEHKDEYIYFNTDHHWTGLGAYYAYQAFCEQTGQEALQLSDCTEKQIGGFSGTFINCDSSLSQNIDTVHYWELPYQTHAQARDEEGEDLYDTSVYVDGFGEGTNVYQTFIGGDHALFVAYNDENKNGKKIAVFKDSFANAMIPYLTYNYEEVHVIDPRYVSESISGYLKDNGITEVFFVNNIMSANNAFTTDGIRGLI